MPMMTLAFSPMQALKRPYDEDEHLDGDQS